MQMEFPWIPFVLLLPSIFSTFSLAKLSSTESRILFQVRQILEYPPSLQQWNRWTDFCSLPPSSSLAIECSGNRTISLTIVGNKTAAPRIIPKSPASDFAVSEKTLSDKFSLESFFTVLTKLSSLQQLSLVRLGLWGPLPAKINRFRSLEVLNISSNFLFGDIPPSISTYQRLRSLVLSNNLLNGSIPDLNDLSVLEELDLSNNYMGPKFPLLGISLVSVFLGNNSLRSEIPQDLQKMSRLQVLDLSSNNLIGPIPSFLFSVSSILSINLAKNELSGALAGNVSCNVNLSFVDISNNLIIGALPSCLASNAGNRTVVVAWNCLSNVAVEYQHSYSFCQKHSALAVEPPARTKNAQSTLKLGVVLGIIGGIVAVLGVLGFLILVILKRVQRKRDSEHKGDHYAIEKTSFRGSSTGSHVPPPVRMTSLGLPPYHVFTIDEMEDATNNFNSSNLVGEESQGQIYKGSLRDGSAIFVKCMKLKQKHSAQALQQHMSKLRHQHLVSVLGHCIVTYQDHPNTPSTFFLVLENIANGSLRDHLTDWKKRDVLKWPQRMAIGMGIARGVQYLHTGGIKGNGLKIDNILLDDNLTPKISCYNIMLPSKVGVDNMFDGQNTLSLENPEKEDIFRLGVILTEVITGRPMQSPGESDDLKFQLERSLAESPSRLGELIDPSIRGTFAYESLKTVVQITTTCLCKDAIRRPTVEDVIWHLQYSVQIQEGWTSSGSLSGNISGSIGTKL